MQCCAIVVTALTWRSQLTPGLSPGYVCLLVLPASCGPPLAAKADSDHDSEQALFSSRSLPTCICDVCVNRRRRCLALLLGLPRRSCQSPSSLSRVAADFAANDRLTPLTTASSPLSLPMSSLGQRSTAECEVQTFRRCSEDSQYPRKTM